MSRASQAAKSAATESRWGDAYRLLAGTALDELDVDDLDLLGTAGYLTGHDDEGLGAWTAAYQRCADAGDVSRAMQIGLRIGQCLGFKGDMARLNGWAERVGHLLADRDDDNVERGYLEYLLGFMRLFGHGDPPSARVHFERAGKIAARFGDRELATLAGITEGRMVIYGGELDRGVAMLDHAVVAIEARELSPLSTGNAYCVVIDACAELQDFTRCHAWSDSFVAWCDSQQELVLYRGNCFIHRAEVIRDLGNWSEALVEAQRACDRLAKPPILGSLAAASGLEGDLHRLLGDLPAAQVAYDRATELGSQPQPGLSLLRLAEGRSDAAHKMIHRVLAESDDPIGRSKILGAAVEISLAIGDVAVASELAAEFREVAAMIGTPLLRARAARAAAQAALARGDAKAALVEARTAFGIAQELGVRFDAASARLLVADACRALGDDDAATTEAGLAQRDLAALRVSVAPKAGNVDFPDGLTAREVDVLRLVAAGRTNRQIAGELFISEKTVSTHLSHIFTKLGLTTRAAATGYAFEHGLTTRGS